MIDLFTETETIPVHKNYHHKQYHMWPSKFDY